MRWTVGMLAAGAAVLAVWGCGPAPAVADGPEYGKGAGAMSFAKPTEDELRRRLTPLQFEVTQKGGTEPAFRNEHWDNHADGIYVDVVSGEPLFSSLDKFDSGTGWPSFVRPLEPDNLVERTDRTLWMVRTEVRSRLSGSHLGHVFPDGPEPTGLRYCMNSAALRFVPVDRLEADGYGHYLPLFAAGGAGGRDAARGRTERREEAIVAAGCFWGVEHLFKELDGVVDTEVGYTGGDAEAPTYRQVCSGRTGHAEAVRVVFDADKTSYENVLRYFFRLHDPTTLNRQHNDVGSQYRSAVFVLNNEQRRIAERVRADEDRSGRYDRPVVTEIAPAGTFWPAEESHQDYLDANPGGYMCHVLRPE